MAETTTEAVAGRLRVLLFAGLAEAAGDRTLEIAWSGGTVADVRRAVVAGWPATAPLVARSVVAMGDRLVGDSEPVPAGAEIAILPPVSGG
jgi:molybdopterin converting factor small subunit